MFMFFLFKQKTAYEMRISDWSSDVCSSDLDQVAFGEGSGPENVKKSRAKLHQFAEAAGRAVSHFEISAILTPESEVESVKIYEDAGVDRVALTLQDSESLHAAPRASYTFTTKLLL